MKTVKLIPKIITLAIYFAMIAVVFPAYADSFIDKSYDFSKMKRLCIWPAALENVPEDVRIFLPGLIDDWTKSLLADNERMRFRTHVKSIQKMWDDIQFVKGPFEFTDPFESTQTAALFYSMLGEACEGVLETSVSITQEYQWQDSKIEFYETLEYTYTTERQRGSDGKWETVGVHKYMPVIQSRIIPEHWLVNTSVECTLQLYDSRSTDRKLVAEAIGKAHKNAIEEEKSAQAAVDATKSALSAALRVIFYKGT
jgi:hypothetical protein